MLLSSLLPGLRRLRAPLVSGVLLLLAAALLLHRHLEGVAQESDRSTTFDSLLQWIGRPGLVAGTLILAYLIGSVLLSAVRVLILRAYSGAVRRGLSSYADHTADDAPPHGGPSSTSFMNGIIIRIPKLGIGGLFRTHLRLCRGYLQS